MRKKIKKYIAIGVIMATLMSVLLGCDVDTKATNPIVTQLSEKYGKAFEVTSLGDRLGKNTATAYVCAQEDPSMRFTARVDTKGNLVFENYAYRTVCRQAEDIVAAQFREQGMDAVCYCNFSPYDNAVVPGTSPQDYIADVNAEDLSVSLVLKESDRVNAAAISQAFQQLYREFGDTFLAVGLYVVSARDYDSLYDHVRRETQAFDGYRLSLYGTEAPIREIIFQVSEDGVTLSQQELEAALSGEGS